MATNGITLDNALVDLTEFSAVWQTQFYRAQTATLINTATSNGAARLRVDMTIETESLEKRNYVEGVVLAAAYDFLKVTMQLPDIFYKYRASAITERMAPDQATPAGSNAVLLVAEGGAPIPGGTIYQGMLLNFEGDTTLYRVNSYTEQSGRTTIFPLLRKAVTTTSYIEYENPTFTGHIMNTPKAKYFSGALDYVSYDIELDEVL